MQLYLWHTFLYHLLFFLRKDDTPLQTIQNQYHWVTNPREKTINPNKTFILQQSLMSQFNLTPQFCRRALVQGQEFIKINSFNRKHRMVACPVNLKSLTWKSVKDHKKHEDYKGSVDTIEFRSISLENLNIKLKFDSRTLNFLCETKEQAIEWGGIFAWLLSRAQETRGEVSNSVKPRVGFLRSSPGKTKRTRSSTVSAGISPHLHDLSSHESFSNPFAKIPDSDISAIPKSYDLANAICYYINHRSAINSRFKWRARVRNILKQFDEIMVSEDIKNVSAFLQGELDCLKGERHERGCDPDYDRGYAARYALEQMLTARASR